MRRGVMSGVLSAAVASVVLSACGHGGVVADRPAVTAAATPGVSSASSTTPGVDVQALWAGTLDSCPELRSDATNPPPDPYHLGAAAAWPMDAEVAQQVSAARAGGTEAFTKDQLINLRVALADTRQQINDETIRGGGEILTDPERGIDPTVSADSVRGDLTIISREWAAERDYIFGEIAAGRTAEPPADIADALSRIAQIRAEVCR